MTQYILIGGATGVVGLELVSQFADSGHRVRADLAQALKRKIAAHDA